jgi:hypothetical protein
MNVLRARMALALTLVLLASSRPAWCQDGFDAETMKQYGGTYLSDCKNPASPRLTVLQNALVFIQGNKRVAAEANLQNANSYFGNSPPEDLSTVLLGELPGGGQLTLSVFTDAKETWIKIDGDPNVLTRIGKPALALKYRRCDAPAKSASVAPPPTPARPVTAATPDAALPDAGGMILDPAFKAAYLKALGRLKSESWLAELDGPARDTKRVTVAGSKYLLTGSCKNHDCAENNVTILYSPERKLVYGKVRMAGKSVLIGSPPPAVAKEIGEFWRKEWGQTP